MACPPRVNFPDAVYHVTSRGNGRAKIFFDDDDRRRFLRQLQDNVDTHAISLFAIGDDAFIDQTKKRLGKQRTGRIQDKDLTLPASATVPLETIDTHVARHYRIDSALLREHGHRAGPAKATAVELACRLTGLSGRDVGSHYGGIGTSAVCNIRRRVRQGQAEILPAVERLAARIRKSEIDKAEGVV